MKVEIDYGEVLTIQEKNFLHLLMQGQTVGEAAQFLDLQKFKGGQIAEVIRHKLHAQTNCEAVARYLGWIKEDQ